MAGSRVFCNSFRIGEPTTITITRDANWYTHDIYYDIGDGMKLLAEKTSQTTIVLEIPASTLYKQIPNSKSGKIFIECVTYGNGMLIGRNITNATFRAVEEDCKPTVTSTIEDTNASTIALTGNKNKLVCYLSKPKVTVTATPKNSATIESVQIYNPVGLTATTTPYTFDTVYSNEFRCTATDSRGYSTTHSHFVNFVEYIPCYFDVEPVIERTESTSTTASITMNGYCFKGNFGKEDNELTLKYRYKAEKESYGDYTTVTIPTDAWKTDGTFTVTANVPNLDLKKQYTFEVIANDLLTSFGDGEEILLEQGIGDLRIAKNYVMAKNNFITGDKDNEEWRCFKARRKLNGDYYDMNYGIGGQGGAFELIQMNDNIPKMLGRFDLKIDGHLYNYLSNMSVAEIMSMIPTMATEGNRGYAILNGGNSSPILIQWGRLKITPTGANVTTKVQVNFLYQFSGMPFVKPERISGVPANVHISPESIIETGFTCCLNRFDTTPTDVVWFAIGNGTNALPE